MQDLFFNSQKSKLSPRRVTSCAGIWALWIPLILALPSLSYAKAPPKKLCQVIRDSLKTEMEPDELCKNYQGHFCMAAKNMSQAICRALDGSFCSTVENRGEGLCRSLKGENCVLVQSAATGYCMALGYPTDKCLQLPSAADEKWERRFLRACS